MRIDDSGVHVIVETVNWRKTMRSEYNLLLHVRRLYACVLTNVFCLCHKNNSGHTNTFKLNIVVIVQHVMSGGWIGLHYHAQ